jgi:AraC-like DNA-binding protein
MDAAAAHGPMRFSTDNLPVRERLTYFREAFGRSMLKVDFEPVEGRPFREQVTFRAFDNLSVVLSETNGNLGVRTKALVADSNDDLIFITILSGFSLPAQLGREFTLRAGSAAMLTAGEWARQDFPKPTRFLAFRVPRATLSTFVANPEELIMREVPATNEALRFLVDYGQTALRRHEPTSPQLCQLFTTHVHELIALALGATRDVAAVGEGRGLRAARLDAVKADIAARADDPRLSVVDVAARQGVTPRYVQMLFERDGTTFSEYVAERRLAWAYQVLTDPCRFDRTITTIAFEVGFANLSYFNRLFRRRYGASPSDVRAAAHRADG